MAVLHADIKVIKGTGFAHLSSFSGVQPSADSKEKKEECPWRRQGSEVWGTFHHLFSGPMNSGLESRLCPLQDGSFGQAENSV